MKILTYDEVDHDQVLVMHLSGFGWPLTEERARAMAEHDGRIWKLFGIYAVRGDKVLGQIIPFRLRLRSTEGVADQLGVAEVVTAPDETRKGIATALMKRIEELGAEEGMTTSWLMTGEHLVAHNLYRKLGYFNVSTFPRGFKRIPKKQAQGSDIKLRQYRKRDCKKLASIYKEYLRGSLGFTDRQWDFLETGIATQQLGKAAIRVATLAGKVVGYAVSSPREGVAFIMEAVAPAKQDFDAIVSALEAQYKGSLVVGSSLIWRKQRDRFVSLDYQIRPTHWYRLMAKPLEKGMSRRKLEHLYGLDDGRFAFMSLDGF
jgi:GNAT superfamily N-acetyltransferase